ncbi:hypothetical protein PTKIN_Ptkin12aG0024100 [Pterospermum kingtungense]
MGYPSRFLSRFFNVFTKIIGIGKSDLSVVNEKQARMHNPAALPEELDRQFSLAEIIVATDNFYEIIGRDGSGSVFKGFLDDGSLVAVKCFSPHSRERFDEFQNEVMLLSQLCHQNLVTLIGFCNDKDQIILVYEYMRNGTLYDHLHGSGYDPLPWKLRLEICIGAARGLHYLHSGAKQGVIHRDIKSSNILLDDNWVCKLCDLGSSKLRSRSKSKSLQRIDTMVLGTPGYLDPEYYIQSQLSEKSDVYSFGVVLFEVLCARKAVDIKLDEDSVNIVSLCRRSIVEGNIYNIIDPYLKGRIAPESLEIFVDIAYSCTHPEGNTRPDMGEVEMMLEHALELQEEADSDMVHLASNGESIYEEVLSCAFVPEYGSTGDSSSVEGDTEITYSAPD